MMALYRTLCYLRTMIWLYRYNPQSIIQTSLATPAEKKPYLLIIIPALREQSHVESAIEHFKKFK